MGHWRYTSSLTPLRAAGIAVSMALAGGLLLAPVASRAQSAQASASPARAGQSSYVATPDATGDEPDDGTTVPSTASAADDTTAADAANRKASSDDQPSDETTGSILDEDIMRLNTREAPLDDRRPRKPDANLSTEETPGIRIGTFVLRPTVTQSINTETQKDGGTKETRAFLETDMLTTLTSDWALHQLLITTEGAWQKNVSGEGEEQPDFKINGDLRLDLPAETTAHLTGGYHFYRQDTDDPNAIQNADQQSDVQELNLGAAIQRDFGILRGSTGIDLARTIYSDATLSDGTTVSLSDRNQTSGTLRGRIGYELSPALIPFIEANVGKTVYDETTDAQGYQRSGNSYGAKAGVEVDLGEKLRGEIGLGYEIGTFDDDRLSDLDATVVDASVRWSPLRGTDIDFGLQTSLQPSTTAGESGYISRAMTTTVTHQLRDNLVGTFLGGITLRDYPSDSSTSDETVYTTSAGLTWNINRYLDLTSTIGYELTSRKAGADSQQWRAGVGLKLKR
ncbi:outer membrane beta-barrel protein [Rhizobium sp. 18055]|uniref:outer membrane beta-barrel protein n=1 Tax=Rhizobium sp. 18055 TaxID=2681403 RepID=UPI0013569862|nr:outer membrane beta-barrel protein [Rhizobium sp. 18055]